MINDHTGTPTIHANNDLGGLTDPKKGDKIVTNSQLMSKGASLVAEESKVYTTQQVASMLNVSDSYIRQLIAKGKAIPKERIGNIYVFTLDEIDRLRARKRTRGPDKKTS